MAPVPHDRAVLETGSDRYVFVRYLAEGGMGAIYLGKKLGAAGFEKDVVLKQLLPEYTSDPKFIDLFLREARVSASLDHANIVHTLDLIIDSHAGADGYFIVMEYVAGADLRTVQRRARRRGKAFPAAAALHIGRSMLEALAYAHKATNRDGVPLGLIHRDISPSNILVAGSGEVKLTDFGIAKMATQRSVFRQVKGKIGYMSPEQAKGQALDQRSDLFSLAVCVYEALVGERLFVADFTATPSMIYAQPVPPPSHKRPDLPRAIDGLFAKALALDPTWRYTSADAFLEALDAFTRRHGLGCSTSEMAAHLREAAGDPDDWRKEDATGPVGGTAVEDDDEARPSSVSGALAGREITGVTSMLKLAAAQIREQRPDEAPPIPATRGAPSSSSWDVPTAASTPSARRAATDAHAPTLLATPPPPAPAEEYPREDEPTNDFPRPRPPAPVLPDGPTLLADDPDERTETRPPSRAAAALAPTPTPLIAVARAFAPSGPPLSARARQALVAALVLGVLVVGVTLGVLLSGPDEPDEPPPAHHHAAAPR